MSSAGPSNSRDWLWAALFGLSAAALRAFLQPLLGDQLPFVVAYPATVLVSLLWGTGPGLLTALVCAAAVVSPQISPELPQAAQSLAVSSFVLGCVVLSLLCGRWRARVRRRALVDPSPIGPTDTPLTTWLRAVLWGAFLIPLTAFVCAAWWGFEQARQEAEAAAAHACDLAYRQAQRSISLAADIAARANAASTVADDPGNEASVHQRLADMAAALPSVVNLNVWDANGRAVARSDLYPVDRSASVADRLYFQELRDRPIGVSNAVHISEVFKGRQTGREIVNVSVRRASVDGNFRGVVAVSLSPEWFRSYYQSLTSEDPKLATFALIRTDGVILARVPPTPDGRTRVLRGSPVLDRVTAGQTSGKLLLPGGATGQTRLVAFRRLDGYPVYVVAGFSRHAMFASWARFVALLAALLVPTTAVLAYVSWVALKKTRREQATFDQLQEQIRRRATAEKSMLESQKLETLAVVTGGVAHDFNNLLAIVNASLHVLKRRHPDVAQEKQVVAMSRAIQSGVRLTRQLLSFSRKQALRPETVHLQTWLPASEGLIQTTLGPDIAWQSAVDPLTLPVRADVGELELALINLVVNARHAMPAGGSLVVHVGNAVGEATGNGAGGEGGSTVESEARRAANATASASDPSTGSGPSTGSARTAVQVHGRKGVEIDERIGMASDGQSGVAIDAKRSVVSDFPVRHTPDGKKLVCLSVRDSGVGIPAALLSKVLEPFFTTREKGAGSGLGLSQVHGFCVQSGGFVRIESVVGVGTTVSMYLPASAEEAAESRTGIEPNADDAPAPMQGLILLVEDNEALSATTEMMLRTAGLSVVCARSADEALAHLSRVGEPPDAVLSDIAMPGSMNGIALAFQLRRTRPELPVLLTTGYAEQVNEATAAGLRVLPKPTAPEDLLAELRAVLPAPVH